MEQKRPFKSNLLIRYFRKTGLPKNWQAVLKEIGDLCDLDPKKFFSWKQDIQLATTFVCKLGGGIPSKKNFFKLASEVERNRWMIGYLSSQTEAGLIEIRKFLSRPRLLKEVMTSKVQPGVFDYFGVRGYMKKNKIDINPINIEIVGGMLDVVREKRHHFYIRNISYFHQLYSAKTECNHPISLLKGKSGSIKWSFEKSARTLFLDEASDCCQGYGKAGEDCMEYGIKQPNSTFLLLSRKGQIFAQSWVIIKDDMIILDSLEAKGDLNSSIALAMIDIVKALKKHFQFVIIGQSPNIEGSYVYRLLNQEFKVKNTSPVVQKKVAKFINSDLRYIYNDVSRGYLAV
jgi:hypothetical protein